MTRTLSILTTYARPSRAIWGAAAAGLVFLGFACDGTTEVGHHLFLILGGVAIGYGAAKG